MHFGIGIGLLSFAAFIGLTVFVYFNYPEDWRKNTMFNLVLIIWHISGLAALGSVFTSFRYITHDGLRMEIARIATYYYMISMLLVFLFGIRLIISSIYRRLKKRANSPISETKKRIIADKRVHSIIFIAAAYVICTIGYFNIDNLHLTEYDIEIPKNSAVKELNAVLISDIHAGAGNWEFAYDDLVKRINEAKPDVLFIAGDVFDETTSDRDVELFGWALKTIVQPKYGMYFIYGNHDDHTEDKTAERLGSYGVKTLNNEMTLIGGDIQLIGKTDPSFSSISTEELIESVKPDTSKPVIMLTHRPKGFQKMADSGCDLAMAGHTHGFNIPQFLGANLFGDMYSGIKTYGSMTAVTTSGVSAWGFHYKFPAVSEVVSLHIRFTGN